MAKRKLPANAGRFVKKVGNHCPAKWHGRHVRKLKNGACFAAAK